jgi:hypothetical protein
MENMLNEGHTFLDAIKQFWLGVRVWKANLVLEDLARQNGRKCDQSAGSREVWSTFDSQNNRYYREVLEGLRKRVHRARPEIADTCMLHHDNAPCHTAISVNEFFTKKGIPAVPQTLYSPDVSPCDLFLFPKLKFQLKGRHYVTMDNIQKIVTDQPRALPQEDFQHCYREWHQLLRRCVASHGN